MINKAILTLILIMAYKIKYNEKDISYIDIINNCNSSNKFQVYE